MLHQNSFKAGPANKLSSTPTLKELSNIWKCAYNNKYFNVSLMVKVIVCMSSDEIHKASSMRSACDASTVPEMTCATSWSLKWMSRESLKNNATLPGLKSAGHYFLPVRVCSARFYDNLTRKVILMRDQFNL